ncbi:hypothetical protein QEZ54_35015 [Catellatospora sp. KI3]|uniref:hypothetical protein n=1 Tax=Catellatospora sp. KI3 TaxID=3041620 RepID=UPI0024822920|nr:hypothetical protein [Catellatospora sp. KI3]MDI1466201.1 hypothetical protein [Catellatospora sp. KI3]
MAKNNQSQRHPRPWPPHAEPDGTDEQQAAPVDHDHGPQDQHGWAGEQAQQRARERSMAARTKAGRTQSSAGQANIMRLKKGNQPRGGR